MSTFIEVAGQRWQQDKNGRWWHNAGPPFSQTVYAESVEQAMLDRIEQLKTGHKALVTHLLALAYPEHDPQDYADHATGVSDLIGLFQPRFVTDSDLFGYKRALIIGPPYMTGDDDE